MLNIISNTYLEIKNPYLLALRPKQWTKNLIVFAAPLFGFKLDSISLLSALLTFGLFCATSSSFYLINDLLDVEADRQHPVKRHRPIASGLVPVPVAIAMAIVLLLGALTIGFWKSPLLGLVIFLYALLQVAYNFRLKRIIILDICAIAAGFILRAIAGGVATNTYLSPWFLLCTAMLALFLGVEKRKAEIRLLANYGGSSRAVLRRYSLPLLHRIENVVSTVSVMSYALWSFGPQVKGASTSWMLLTFPFVLYGIFRYQLLSDLDEIGRRKGKGNINHEKTERPEEVLLTDLPLLINLICWIATIFIILFLKNKGLIN